VSATLTPVGPVLRELAASGKLFSQVRDTPLVESSGACFWCSGDLMEGQRVDAEGNATHGHCRQFFKLREGEAYEQAVERAYVEYQNGEGP
jgi:hypothetical protein